MSSTPPEQSGANPGEITGLLRSHAEGDPHALERLVPLVYDELRGVARSQLRRLRPGATLDTTALVHEAFLRLAPREAAYRNRGHFLAVAARAMRQILVDQARRHGSRKRGGGVQTVSLEDAPAAVEEQAELLLFLDDALRVLAKLNQRLVRVVECRFFAGYSEPETASALAISVATVQRDWSKAKAWLRRELARAG